jgi:hypothetical protein
MGYRAESYRVWVDANASRYTCEPCRYSTHSFANFRRHRCSIACEVRRYARTLPVELCHLIHSFFYHKANGHRNSLGDDIRHRLIG